MKGREIVLLQLSPDEAEGIIDEIRRLAGRKGCDIAYDYPKLQDLRDVLLDILG